MKVEDFDYPLNEDLIVEGMYRDLVRTIQVLRKEAGLKVEQRIGLSIITEGKLFEKVIEKYIDKIIDDTLTESFNRKAIDKPLITKENLEINGEIVKIQIKEI